MMLNVISGFLLGKLNIHALPNNVIAAGGALTMIGALFSAALYLTVFKKWTWLWKEWFTSLDPKKIGVMYIFVALIMLLRGLGDALLIKAQQSLSVGNHNGILSSNHFQQIVSAHGTMMIFFVAMGLVFGIINLIMPLQLGSRDVAFPFLNSISFWLFACGFVLINLSLMVGEFSAAGWLAYPPLSELQYSPGVGVDYWIWSLQIAGIGSLLSGVNFLVTIIKMRAPGMKLMDMPMFLWSVMGSMTLVIFAFPILTVTLTLLYLDRTLGTHFFTAGGGGNMMMYVNLIWAWGHPEVYILILPAFGVFSEVVSTFSSKRLFGYKSMVYAIWAIVFLAFIVWLHHFFTMGAGSDVNAFFGIMTMIIAIPTGVKIFNWLFTMYRGRIRFHSSMLWFLGFVVLFTIGGVAGVIMAIPPADFQLHNTLFLVAHFHTMIVSGVMFGYFAGLYYWFPKMFGFKLNDVIGRKVVYLWIGGFILSFVPLYILGLMGATRRLDHYSASLGWQQLFIVSGIGVAVLAGAAGLQVWQLVFSIKTRKDNMDKTGDPWKGRSLEWATSSPVAFYNFPVIPKVKGRDAYFEAGRDKKVLFDAEFEPFYMPKNSPYGFIIALFAFFIGFGMVWHIWWMVILGFIAAIFSIIYKSTDEDTEYLVDKSMLSAEDRKMLFGEAN